MSGQWRHLAAVDRTAQRVASFHVVIYCRLTFMTRCSMEKKIKLYIQSRLHATVKQVMVTTSNVYACKIIQAILCIRIFISLLVVHTFLYTIDQHLKKIIIIQRKVKHLQHFTMSCIAPGA